MKLFVFSDGVRHGCYIFREEIPLEALERRGHTIAGGLTHPTGPCLADVDLFIFPRLAAMDYPLVVDELQRNAKPLVYDMDDAADLFERHHTSYFQVRNLLPSYYFFLRQADLVTTTTSQLAEHFRSLGARRVEVLPNCPLPRPLRPRPVPSPSSPTRICFTGWTAHINDASFWLTVIDSLRRLRQDFVPVLFGLANTSDESGSSWMDKCKAAVNANPLPNYEFGQSLLAFREAWLRCRAYLEWHPMVPVDDYWDKLDALRIDIGCAALLDTPFNRCKSAVKFYDFAGAGAVTLASDIPPYSDEPMVHIPNTVDAWVRMLSLYLDSPQARAARLAEQRAWIAQHRNPDDWAIAREQVYQSLLPASAIQQSA